MASLSYQLQSAIITFLVAECRLLSVHLLATSNFILQFFQLAACTDSPVSCQ